MGGVDVVVMFIPHESLHLSPPVIKTDNKLAKWTNVSQDPDTKDDGKRDESDTTNKASKSMEKRRKSL